MRRYLIFLATLLIALNPVFGKELRFKGKSLIDGAKGTECEVGYDINSEGQISGVFLVGASKFKGVLNPETESFDGRQHTKIDMVNKDKAYPDRLFDYYGDLETKKLGALSRYDYSIEQGMSYGVVLARMKTKLYLKGSLERPSEVYLKEKANVMVVVSSSRTFHCKF